MKLFNNIFGAKNNKNSKNEPNTLAEANGSPDMRLATKKEKEDANTVSKKEVAKKEPKISTLTPQDLLNITAKKSEQKKAEPTSANKPTAKSTVNTTEKAKATATKSTPVSNPKTEKKEAKKPTHESNNAELKNVKKEIDKLNSEAKKLLTKTDSTKVEEKKPTAKGTSKSTQKTVEAKKETKAATTSSKKATTAKETPGKKDTKNETAEEVTVTKSAKTGKFEIKKSKDGRFVFNLYASNNVIVATSQVYSSSTSAMNGIKSVIANASTSPVEDQTLKNYTEVPYPKWEIYRDKGEQYRFRLCASNGSCVCHSQGYTSKTNCKKGIESIIKFASDAEITKAYLEKKDK